MSIKTNAELIRDETITGANTATRVGGNLVEIADDLIAKQIEIDVNTAKTGISSGQASAIVTNTSKVGFTDALVASAPTVAANTAKVGISTGQASAIVNNTEKVSFDSTSSTRLANTSGTNTGDQDLSVKQNTLVSGTNIKTINGSTLLGSGDLVVSSGVTGSGTINKLSKFTASGAVGDSQIFDTGTNIGIGTITPTVKLQISEPSTNKVGLIVETGGGGTSVAFRDYFNPGKSINVGHNGSSNTISGTNCGVNGFAIGGFSTKVVIFTDGNPITFETSYSEKMRISPAGNFIINSIVDNGVDSLKVNGSAIVTTLKTSAFTVATLPAPPAQGLGARAHVTDALNPTYLGTLTGGGTVKCPVFYNGTAWVSA